VRASVVRRTKARLADGRDIFFYDRPGAPERQVHDLRDLGPVRGTMHMRYDRVLDEWVTIASLRQQRTHLPPQDECPLCPSGDGRSTEIPQEDYDVVVFANRFPSFVPAPSLDPALTTQQPQSASIIRPSTGRCEVVCFTSDHDASFADLDPAQARLVVDTWADRTRELSALPGVEQVFCFENRGEAIGVTLSHPHGQIYAYPYVTPRTRQMLRAADAYRSEHGGGNLFADVLAAERADGSRVVSTAEHWTAFVPAAARWPVEIHLYPHRQVPSIDDLADEERDELVQIYLDLLGRLDRVYDKPLPYIAAWHQAPVRQHRDLAYTHLQLFSVQRSVDRLKFLAGSESAMGAFVNDVVPEDMAARLRALEVGRV
jgi:UDPglucose--hexose-1-phosphate uridylyltransferase